MTLCVFGDGAEAIDRAYGQPVCAWHLWRCQMISAAERMEWRERDVIVRGCVKFPRLGFCDVDAAA